MTKPLTPHADTLIAALPDAIAGHVRPTTRLDYNVERALREQHWTLEQLVTEASRDLDNAVRVGAVIDERIAICATVKPPKTRTRTGLAKVHDGCCEDGWIYIESETDVQTIKCHGKQRSEASR